MDKNYKILIVDDEQSILDMLKLQLESEGYTVCTAASAKEALDKLTSCPDIILLDINMSGMNVLMVGGDDYITKPFSMNELLARISAHLRREMRSHSITVNECGTDL